MMMVMLMTAIIRMFILFFVGVNKKSAYYNDYVSTVTHWNDETETDSLLTLPPQVRPRSPNLAKSLTNTYVVLKTLQLTPTTPEPPRPDL